MTRTANSKSAFTLVELSIVLVIVGLIIGGVLVGRDLISAAGVRAQISQIEKYQTAVNTFRGKYGYLPGDIPDPTASQYGFIARGLLEGQGDGDGVIEGCGSCTGQNYGAVQGMGETGVFWVDLSKANLLPGTFNAATETTYNGGVNAVAGYLPAAAIGKSNVVYTWSGGMGNFGSGLSIGSNRTNYFGLSTGGSIWGSGVLVSNSGITVSEAASIDAKVDDGLPQSGRVTAIYLNGQYPSWAGNFLAGNGRGGPEEPNGVWGDPAPYLGATAGHALTCFDNSSSRSGTPGVAGATEHYSLEINSGTGLNCALSFQFQ